MRHISPSRIATALALALSLFSGIAASAGEASKEASEPEGPGIIHFTGEEYPRPYFVPGSHALDDNGKPNAEYFVWPETIEKWMASDQKDGCARLEWIHTSIEGVPEWRKDFRSFIQKDENIILARVTQTTGGFGAGILGTLVSFDVEEILKGDFPAPHKKYFFFPMGEVHLDDICLSRVDDRFGAVPQVGDQVILAFTTKWGQSERPTLSVGWSSGVITIKDGHVAKLPRVYRKTDRWVEGQSIEQVTSHLRQTLSLEVTE